MLRFSLKQLLALVTLSAVAIVSLRYASAAWQGVVGMLAMLSLFAAILVSIFDRGPRQVFAIGFFVVMLLYGMLLMTGQERQLSSGVSNNYELRASRGRLPTTLLLRYVLLAVDHSAYVDQSTGEDVAAGDAANPSSPPTMFAGPTINGRPVQYVQRPDERVFTPIGHYWWALLLGYCGGHFARAVYLRRVKEQASAEGNNRA